MVLLQGNIALSKPSAVCNAMCHPQAHLPPVAKAGFGDQLKQLFTQLFNTADWPARWHCGHWSELHGWVYILSDLLIWAAYFAIPLLLFRIINKRKDIPFPGLLWLFIAFILLCGTTHLIDAVIFWWPAYRLSAVVELLTAFVSITAVFALYKVLPMVYTLRTVEQLEKEIEERKKAEQEARNRHIQQQATEDLMKKKDEFMSIASHELKTPITSVKASMQILERMVQKNDNLLPVSPFVEKASRQVEKLTRIINDLLDVTRIQEGKLTLDQSSFNMMALVKECIDECDPKYTFDIECSPDLMIHADRYRIDQVLSNLLINAVKYSPQSSRVKVLVESRDDFSVKVSVIDYGIGIPPDRLEQVFDRFYRVENTSQNFPGVGLGLYISSEIIKRHGGHIDVKSKPDEGSTFYFILPQSNAN